MHPSHATTLPSARPARPARRRVIAVAVALLVSLASLLAPARAWALEDPDVQGTAAILADPETGVVLYEKNADERRYPASMTKVMTALVVLEHADLADTVTMDPADFEALPPDSSVAGFEAGETLTVEQLLYGLLLPSGNECAYALARHVGGGSVDAFVQMMNDKAAELGCEGTHFVNPCGLHDPNHYTTARDMYRIVRIAMQDETFASIVAEPTYEVAATNLQPAREIESTNELLDPESVAYLEGATGVKSGNTYEAGRCLAASAERGDLTLYSVVMGCADVPYGETAPSMTESKRLLEWGFDSFAVTPLVEEGEEVEVATVADSADEQTLSVVAADTVTWLLPIDADPSAVEVSYDLPEGYVAPVERGTELGEATYRVNGEVVGTARLVAGNDVEISPMALVRNTVGDVLGNRNLMIGVGAGLVAVVVLVVALVTWRRLRRRAVGEAPAGSGRHASRHGGSRHLR